MNSEKTPIKEVQPYFTDQTVTLDFHRSQSDSSCYMVSQLSPKGTKKKIGNIQMEIRSDDPPIIYVCTDTKGKRIFPPTDDFAKVEDNFQKYAKRLIAEKATQKNLEALAERRKEEMEQLRKNRQPSKTMER